LSRGIDPAALGGHQIMGARRLYVSLDTAPEPPGLFPLHKSIWSADKKRTLAEQFSHKPGHLSHTVGRRGELGFVQQQGKRRKDTLFAARVCDSY
jgi:hypothetical protein